ncbi:MAG: RluA family pseudouridine synthase [Saprospiraceae bacterium]|nr:RluA family pseudouridine synthase [Saprospiraceae bacterium]
MKLQVIYEDNHLIAVNKSAGVLVQGDETGDRSLDDMVKEYIKIRYQKPGDVFLGVCHRIDRPVSGAVIFARTSKALERMNKLFADRLVDKKYWAIVNERPDPLSGKLINYLDKDRERNITKVLEGKSRRHPDAKLAELDYELIASMGNQHLLEVQPTTGRSHQIRAQLANIGCRIRGDVKYGAPKANKDGSICLHCRSMTFVHPVSKTEITIAADVPEDPIWHMFAHITN